MYKSLFFCIFLQISLQTIAQDTLVLSFDDADQLFQEKNISLLASALRIERAKALEVQAKVYPNPVFTAEINAYDPQHQQAFHVGSSGQKGFQLEQLILIGGKRKAEIDMAKTNTVIAEIEFQKLLLELKYQLHISLFQAGQQQLLIQKYNKQLQFLDTLIQAFRVQVEKGNIPMNEFVRLKGAYIQLNNERANLIQEFYQTQTTIQTLLQVTSIVIPKEDQLDFSVYLNIQPVEDLIQLAKSQQLDLQIIHQNQILAQQYLMYQKRVAIPDINIFVSYDQRGGAFNNQLNTGISIPLPIWNRNQGAIKSAQLETQEMEYTLKSRELEITNAIRNTYAAYKQTISEYVHTKELYNDDFEKVQQGMSMNFQKRNISLIEFMDYFESYNQVINELSRIKTQLVINAEQFTILTGKELFKP